MQNNNRGKISTSLDFLLGLKFIQLSLTLLNYVGGVYIASNK